MRAVFILPSQVERETALRNRIIGVGQGHARRQDGIAAVGDVRKGAAVDKSAGRGQVASLDRQPRTGATNRRQLVKLHGPKDRS